MRHLLQERMKNKHIEGIDLLRAIMSVFVVVWHMNGGGTSLIFSKEKYLEHILTMSDIVNFNILLLAVPTFIFVSCFLYALGPVNIAALRRRLRRIMILLAFWPLTLIIFNNGYQGIPNIAPHSFFAFAVLVLRAGNTIYYFFPSLIICLVIAHIAARLSVRLQVLCFVISTTVVACMPIIAILSSYYPIAAFWNPLNFIPFPWAAVLVAQNRNMVRRKCTIIAITSATLFVLFSAIEWNCLVNSVFFQGQVYAFPAYARVSLLFGVTAIAVVAIDPRVKTNRIVKFMSMYSLALYCLHPFLIGPTRNLLTIVGQSAMATNYAAIVLVIVLSYAIAIVLKHFFLKEELIS